MAHQALLKALSAPGRQDAPPSRRVDGRTVTVAYLPSRKSADGTWPLASMPPVRSDEPPAKEAAIESQVLGLPAIHARHTKASLKDTFDAAFCINLARRPDRWERFTKQIPADWPFVEIQRFDAVDGRQVPTPAWWRAGAGAWGCARSHVTLIERALNSGWKSLLIFEDDAVFCEGFTGRVTEFLKELPNSWGMIYLGGQHLAIDRHPPQKVSDGVYRPYNVNRTHAYALQRPTMEKVYQHLMRNDWQRNHHIDHHFGLLHQTRQAPVYCPATWLVGQDEGQSNINGRAMPQRFWLGSQKIVEAKPEEEPFIAVLGLHGSGSSCLAGVLHHLGVFLGERLGGFYGNEPDKNQCGFEAEGLRRICEAVIPFPQTKPRFAGRDLVPRLRKWINEKRREAADRNTLAGGKYPQLCQLGRELLDVCGDQLRLIVAERPLAESIESLQRRCPRQDAQQLADHQAWLEEGKQWLCSQVPSNRQVAVKYTELLRNPLQQVERIAKFLEISPTESQLRAVSSWIDPDKRHVGAELKTNDGIM